MKPSLGRIVIYKLTEEEKSRMSCDEGDERAGIIVKCSSNEENARINVFIFPETSSYQGYVVQGVIQGEEKGQWHEPKRV